ncbi:MAG: hypothetical protein JNL82_06350 [Myxococcales bacterium]|nr:hypothetical protein [Myxococcales bacterium]
MKKVGKVAAKAAAKPAAKAASKPAAKKVAAKAEAKQKPEAKAKPEAKVETKKPEAKKPEAKKPEAKPAAKPAAKKPEARAKPSKPAPAPAPEIDDDDLTPAISSRPTAPAPELPQDLADVAASQAQPELPTTPRKKSVLEVAEEDDDFDAEPPLPTADDIHGLLDRLRKVAQFGGDALEELPRLIEQLEQIDDPAVMPRLLALLEDNDPYGIYWNVLYVLEKFDDAYLRALLGGVEALYARAPQWAYTCVIRILNTRGDEDDCTAAFERLVNEGPESTRTLVLQILRELANDPDTDADQKQNIARTITAIGGASAAE